MAAGGGRAAPAPAGRPQVGGLPPLAQLSLEADPGEGSAFPLRSDVFLGSSDAPGYAGTTDLQRSGLRPIVLRPPQPYAAERDAAFAAYRQQPSPHSASSSASSSECGSSECGSSECGSSGSSVYEMPSDVIGLRCPSTASLGAAEVGCCVCDGRGRSGSEARLGRELQELGEKVASLDAEMVVQHAELAMADKRFAQIAEALQCSICLDTFGHPHSLACGHTFCQECLLQWLAQSKQCPTCRAPVRQRPAVAFAVCDVIRCVHPPGGGGEQLPGASQADDDPWASLFPARTAVSAAGIAAGRATLSNFVVCSVCSRNMLEGETCINCAIDALHRSITTRLGSTAAAPLRQPRPIQLSHVTRRRNEILASADRLLASTRRFESAIASSGTHTAPDQPPRPDNPYSARFASLLDTSAQLQDIQLRNARLARRLALLPGRVPPPLSQSPSPSSSPSPPDSLFDPTDLVGGRRSSPSHTLSALDAYRELVDVDGHRSLAGTADEDWLDRRSSRLFRPTRDTAPVSGVDSAATAVPPPPPPGNASLAEYILRNGYEAARRVWTRSPSPRPGPAVAAAPLGSRRAHALQSRSLLNDYMLQLDDDDSTADEADEDPPAREQWAGAADAGEGQRPRRPRSIARSLADAARDR